MCRSLVQASVAWGDPATEFRCRQPSWARIRSDQCEQETSDPPAPDTQGVAMRKLIASNLISLDGYASGPGGDVMALPFDKSFSEHNLELMQAADILFPAPRPTGTTYLPQAWLTSCTCWSVPVSSSRASRPSRSGHLVRCG